MIRNLLSYGWIGAGFVLAASGMGCDSALPSDPAPELVIEGFIATGKPLPAIRLSRMLSVASSYDSARAAVNEADISVWLGDRRVFYAPDGTRRGVYHPIDVDEITAMAGDSFALDLQWEGKEVRGGGTVPPSIKIVSTEVRVPDEPVSAVLLDSLALSDSLSIGAQQGYIYPIEVSISWRALNMASADYWVRAQLRPYAAFSSTVVDLFLRSEEVFMENDALYNESEIRSWTGVYAVGVDAEDEPVPVHALRIALIRSGPDYARFAATRHAPERREPESNLDGAAGIFTAISVDSTRVQVGTPP